MADLEKVLKGLGCCTEHDVGKCLKCPYGECLKCPHGVGLCHQRLAADVLELLKEQRKQRFFVDSDGKITPLPIQKHGRWIDCDYGEWKCSACNDSWYLEVGDPEHNEMNYCPMCGAKMDEEVINDASQNS